MTKILVTQSFGFVKYFCEQYGGTAHTNSLAIYDYLKRVVCFSTRNEGQPNIRFWQTAHNSFVLKKPCYIVSLSDVKDINIAQPASCFHTEVGQSSYLWLNGMLSNQTIKSLASETGIQSDSDSEHLLHYMLLKGDLSKVKEPFSCVIIHMGNMYVARSDNGILYTDELMSFSTEEFDDSYPIMNNKVFQIDFISETTKIESVF